MADDKLDFKRVLPIFVIVLVDVMGLSLIIPLLPLYSAAFGANALIIGLLSATYPMMQFIGSPILGSLSDRFGRKPVLIVSQIGTFSGFILLGFANILPLIFISRVIDGISGANISTAKAAITDCTNKRTRTQGLGLIGAAFGIGFVIGPAISGVALWLTNDNFRVPAFIAAAFSLVSILLTSFWFEETYSDERRKTDAQKPKVSMVTKVRRAFSHPIVAGLLGILFVQQLVISGFEQLIPLFTLNRLGLDGKANALMFVFMGLLLAVVQGAFIGPMSRRMGERRLIQFGLLLLGVGLIGVSIIPELPLPSYSQAATIEALKASTGAETINVAIPADDPTGYFGVIALAVMLIPTTLGGYLIMPAINSLVTQHAAPEELGSILGISTSVVSLSHIIAPILGGALFRLFGSTAPFMSGGIFLLLIVAATWQMQMDAESDLNDIGIDLQPATGMD